MSLIFIDDVKSIIFNFEISSMTMLCEAKNTVSFLFEENVKEKLSTAKRRQGAEQYNTLPFPPFVLFNRPALQHTGTVLLATISISYNCKISSVNSFSFAISSQIKSRCVRCRHPHYPRGRKINDGGIMAVVNKEEEGVHRWCCFHYSRCLG